MGREESVSVGWGWWLCRSLLNRDLWLAAWDSSMRIILL